MIDVKLREYIKDIFDLPEESIVILHRNPNEFFPMFKENINPTHESIIWGYLKPKYRKYKIRKYIKVGKVFTPVVAFLRDIYDKTLFLINYLCENIDVVYYCYYIGVALVIICVLANMPLLEIFLAKKFPIV